MICVKCGVTEGAEELSSEAIVIAGGGEGS